MFNVEPPSNVYSEEPSKDITFGVDNPGYVGMTELADLNADNKLENEDGGNHYEIIDIAENVENVKNEDKSPETLSNLNIEISRREKCLPGNISVDLWREREETVLQGKATILVPWNIESNNRI